MTKHYGCYGFPSDPIADCSIRLIHVALELCEITCNGVYNFSWIIDIPCVISSMNALFDKKRQINILGKFPSDNNARNITHNCEFSNAVLRHTIRMLPGINEKTQSHILRRVLEVCPASSPDQHENICVFFSYCHNARQTEPLYAQFCMFLLAGEYIYRYVISTNILAWSTNCIEVVLMFSKKKKTRTPAFWGYPPPPHDYPYYWVILDPKSKKVITCNTPYDANYDLCQIWKECKQNCRFFFKVKAEKFAKNWNFRTLL